ncbi:MAG TPA: hypothetical protein VJB05_02115 [archaeon]|nr:hypothetical protein [archaeon]
MDLLRSLALVIISVLLIFSLSLITIGISANGLLYPGVYENTFEKNNFYDVIQEKLLQQTGLPQGTITKEEIKSGIATLLSNTFSYLRSETSELNLKISINQNTIRSYLASQMSNLPTCQAGLSLPDCKPPGMTTMQLVDYMLSQSSVNLADMSKIDLSQFVPQIKDQLDSMRQIVQLFQKLILALLLLSIILIALLVLLARNHGLAKWLGINLLVCGVVVVVIGSILSILMEKVINITENQISVVFKDIISAVSGTILLYGALLFIVGLLFLLYHLLKKKSKKTNKK